MIKSKRIISYAMAIIALVLVLSFTVSSSSVMNSGSGTQMALGSPILNDTFSSEDWNPYEFICFGVFASNFVEPFVDDYQTAFSSGMGGTDGKGYKAINFSSNGTQEQVTAVLNYIINEQQLFGLTPLMIKTVDYSGGDGSDIYNRKMDGKTSSEAREARLKDLIMGGDSGEAFSFESKRGEKIVEEELTAVYKSEVSKAILPYFYVSNAETNTEKIMLDFSDGWDVSIVQAMFGKLIKTQYSKEASENIKRIVEEGDANPELPAGKLFVDVFGNIMTMDNDGRQYMVLAASSNQHITFSPTRNMLTSTVLGGGYLSLSTTQIHKYAVSDYAQTWYSGMFESLGLDSGEHRQGMPVLGSRKNNQIENGTIVLYHDSDLLRFSAGTYGSKMFETLTANVKTSNTSVSEAKLGVFGALALHKDVESLLSKEAGSAFVDISELAGFTRTASTVPILHEIYLKGTKYKQSILGDPTSYAPYSSSSYLLEGNRFEPNGSAYMNRRMIGFLGNYLSGNIDTSFINTMSKESLEGMSEELQNNIKKSYAELGNELKKLDNVSDIYKWMYYNSEVSDGNLKPSEYTSALFSAFVRLSEPPWPTETGSKPLETTKFPDLSGSGYSSVYDWTAIDSGLTSSRVITLYQKNPTITTVSNYLSIDSSVDFAQWAPYIYVSYLDFYGLLAGTPKFDTTFFNPSSEIMQKNIDDLLSGVNTKTKEDKEKAVLDSAYLMLNPAEGRELRKQINMNSFIDLIYDWYNKIVYGGSVVDYSNSGVTADRTSSGFLMVDSYYQNFLTAWFMGIFSKICVILIGALTVVAIVLGLLSKKNLMWYLMTVIAILNISILTPALGEVVPFVCNNIVNSLFEGNTSFWALSESVENQKLEQAAEYQSRSYRSGNESDATKTLQITKLLNPVFADRSLMLKYDISRKVTESEVGSLNSLQNYASTRWLIPTIIRQYASYNGGGDDNYNYVYIPLTDALDSAAFSYLMKRPDVINESTYTSVREAEDVDNIESVTNIIPVEARKTLYPDYSDTSINMEERKAAGLISPSKTNEGTAHTSIYLLPDFRLPSFAGRFNEGKEESTNSKKETSRYEDIHIRVAEVVSNNPQLRDELVESTINIERIAGRYDSWDFSSIEPEFLYLWNTESVLPYMYAVVRDTFPANTEYTSLVGSLLGSYVELEDGLQRSTFMHSPTNYKELDVLDMEEMFTNVIPYMYKMSAYTGGRDGNSGALGNEKIKYYTIYSNNNKAWLYRCNWAIKLFEDETLNRPARVPVYTGGNMVDIMNPMDPTSYPPERPMVFSESQMFAQNLTEFDLTDVELKILSANKKTIESWTMLINYSALDGMTSEVLYRQMSLEAMINFNKVFSSSQTLSASKALYPQTVELRNISFDSLLRMIMLSATRDTNFIYGDTIYNIVSNFDIISAILLLLCAFGCAVLVPLVRNVIMAMLFYFSLIATARSLVSGGKQHWKITFAYLINLGITIILNAAYYLLISAMVTIKSPTDLLNTSTIFVKVNSPIWILLVLGIVTALYLYISYVLIKFTFKNRNDLGLSAFTSAKNGIISKVKDMVSGIMGRFGGDGEAINSGGDGEVGDGTVIIAKEEPDDETGDDIIIDYGALGEMGERVDELSEANADTSDFIKEQIEKGSRNI